MNLFITWNAKVVVPIADTSLSFPNYTIFTYELEDCLYKMNIK